MSVKTVAYTFRREIDGIENDIYVYDKRIEIYRRINKTRVPDQIIETNEDHHTDMLSSNDINFHYNKIMKIIDDNKK